MTDRFSSDTEKLRRIIEASRKIVFFGGAGVSTESGIPDFRSASGLYSGKLKTPERPEVMLSHSYFISHTEEFYDFYKRYMLFPGAKPNKAHLALAELERQGKLCAVVTQNIDGLHTAAGSKTVYELHGSSLRNYCTSCGEFYGLDYILESEGIPRCRECGSIIKPDVVLYEEALDQRVIENAVRAVESADTMIVGGTSLEVYPAASLVRYFNGGSLVLINKSPTRYDNTASLIIREPIGETLDMAVN